MLNDSLNESFQGAKVAGKLQMNIQASWRKMVSDDASTFERAEGNQATFQISALTQFRFKALREFNHLCR